VLCQRKASVPGSDEQGVMLIVMLSREQCDQTRDNACLSTVDNSLSGESELVRNEAYSSLSSARPSASYLSFNPIALIASAQAPSATTAQSPATPTTVLLSTSTQSPTAVSSAAIPTAQVSLAPKDGASLNGGTIGGVVVGAIAGVTLVAISIWWFRRKGKKSNRDVVGVNEHTLHTSGPEKRTDLGVSELPSGFLVSELRGEPARQELPARGTY